MSHAPGPVPGRRPRRPFQVPTRPLQGLVSYDMHSKARQAANAAGVSMGIYLDELIRRDEVDEAGCPLWLPPKKASEDQHEFPLGA